MARSGLLHRADRRLRISRALTHAVAALAIASVAATTLVLVGIGGAAGLALLLALPVALAALLGLGRPDLERAAAVIDRGAELHDLLKTALELETRPASAESFWRPVLLARAESAAQRIQLSEVAPIRPPRLLWMSLSLLLLVPATAWLLGQSGLVAHRGAAVATAANVAAAEASGREEGEEAPAAESDAGADLASSPASETPGQRPETGRSLSTEALAGDQPVTTADGAADADAEGEARPGLGSDDQTPAEAARQPAELVDEQRELLPAEDPSPAGAEGEHAGGDSAESSADAAGGEQAPSMREVSDEVVALDMPGEASPQSEVRRSNEANAAAAATGAEDALSAELDAESAEPADGPATPGPSSAPQSGEVDPLGEATELPVTLEEVLLEARAEREMKPERRQRASRRHEAAVSAARGDGALAAPGAASTSLTFLEQSARSLAAMHRYFAPDPPPDASPPRPAPGGTQPERPDR